MKGISIIIILSIVWSVISAIIEKRKAAQKKAMSTNPTVSVESQPQPEWKVEPIRAKIESLRRKKKVAMKGTVKVAQAPVPPPKPIVKTRTSRIKAQKPKEKKIAGLTSLHEEACDLQPAEQLRMFRKSPSVQLAKMLKDRRNIRTAIVLSEVLEPPLALRK